MPAPTLKRKMRKIILIVLIALMSVVLALGVGYIAYRGTGDSVEPTAHNPNTNGSIETTGYPDVEDEQPGESAQDGEETAETKEIADTTAPTETVGDDSGLEDNELPPM